MFTHDPFQAYQNPGAFGGAAPYGLPHTGINPLAMATLANPGIGGFGQYPQQQFQGYPQQAQGYGQQLMGYPQQQGPWQQLQALNPLTAGLHNPYQHHQVSQLAWQNPLLNPMLAHQAWQQQQTPFGYPLAPQSFIGGGGIGQPYGQLNPLALLALRQAGLGISPFAGY